MDKIPSKETCIANIRYILEDIEGKKEIPFIVWNWMWDIPVKEYLREKGIEPEAKENQWSWQDWHLYQTLKLYDRIREESDERS